MLFSLICSSEYLFYSTVALLVAILFFYLAFVFLRSKRLHHVPGPWLSKVSELHLAIWDWKLCRNDRILQWHRDHGPIVRVAPNEVSVATMDAVRQVYGTSSRWEKSTYFDHFMGYNERSMFATKAYHEHQKLRRLTSSFYQATSVFRRPEVEARIRDRVHAVLKYIHQRQEDETDVYNLADWYAIDNITHLILGPAHCTQSIEQPGFERQILQELKELQIWGPVQLRFPMLFDLVSRPLSAFFPRLQYIKANDHLSDWCYRLFSTAIEDPSLRNSYSLVRHLVEAKQDSYINTTAIAAEVLDNINAAEATVAVTATYFIWRLSQSPHWQRRLRDELRTLATQSDGLSSFSDVHLHAPILEACLKEVYRLHPASSGRAERIVPPEGCTLSGVYLPAGTVVTSSIVAIHREPGLFPFPEHFLPGRWLQGDAAEGKARDAHLIPFGFGGRICLGKPLATMEIKLLIAGLYLQYESLLGPHTTPESMKQCSTHDAVPRALKCLVQFRRL